IPGSGTSIVYTNTVKYAAIASTGDITASFSTSGNNLPASIGFFGAATANGFIYVGGGYDGSSRNRDVSYAQVSTSDGTVGSWTTVSNAVSGSARSDLSLVSYNSNLYAVGGYDGTNALGEIQYASLNATTGAPGSFSYTTYQDRNGRARQAV